MRGGRRDNGGDGRPSAGFLHTARPRARIDGVLERNAGGKGGRRGRQTVTGWRDSPRANAPPPYASANHARPPVPPVPLPGVGRGCQQSNAGDGWRRRGPTDESESREEGGRVCFCSPIFLLSFTNQNHLPPRYPTRFRAALSPPTLRVLHHDRAVAVVAVGSADPAAQRRHVQAPAQAGGQEALHVGGGALSARGEERRRGK